MPLDWPVPKKIGIVRVVDHQQPPTCSASAQVLLHQLFHVLFYACHIRYAQRSCNACACTLLPIAKVSVGSRITQLRLGTCGNCLVCTHILWTVRVATLLWRSCNLFLYDIVDRRPAIQENSFVVQKIELRLVPVVER
jgi:Zn-finger protein